MNPDLNESHRLRGWYDSVGSSASYSEYRREGDNNMMSSGTAVCVSVCPSVCVCLSSLLMPAGLYATDMEGVFNLPNPNLHL